MARKKSSRSQSQSRESEKQSPPVRSSDSEQRERPSEQEAKTGGYDDETDRPTLLLNVSGLRLPTRARPFVVEYFPTPEQAWAERRVRAYELDNQQACAERALASVIHEWNERSKALGMSAVYNVAYRTKHNLLVAPLQYVIRIDVDRKYPVDVLKEKGTFAFPPAVDGVPTKVRQIRVVSCLGKVSAMAGNSSQTFLSEPVIRGGIAIGSTRVPGEFGTLGICIPTATSLVAVTNAHVAGTNSGSSSADSILQPPNDVNAVVGHLVDSIMTSVVDGASFSSEPGSARPFGEGIKGLTDQNGNEYSAESYRFLKENDLQDLSWLNSKRVFKVGAQSHRSDGSILDTNTISPAVAHIPPNNFGSIFRNVIAVQCGDMPFIEAGDSGSALIYEDQDNNGDRFPVVLGLNFAASDDGKISYAIPFGRVINTLGITAQIDRNRLWP